MLLMYDRSAIITHGKKTEEPIFYRLD